MRYALITLPTLLLATPATADPTVEQFLKMQNKDLTTVYLDGMLEGFTWYGGYVRQQKGQEVYCEPAQIALTRDQALYILNRYIKQHPEAKTLTIGHAMIRSLHDALPCGR